MTDDTKSHFAIYTSRDVYEAYGQMTSHLADIAVKGAAMALSADAHKGLSDYDGGTETPASFIVRARDEQGILDLAIRFISRRAGVCFWDELPADQLADFEIGIDYERNQPSVGATQ